MWTSHGRLTLLAHCVADRGLVELAPVLLQAMAPVHDCLAAFGQVGAIGPVALAVARLHRLLGDASAARAHLGSAAEVAARAGGGSALLHCRLAAAEWSLEDGAATPELRQELTRSPARPTSGHDRRCAPRAIPALTAAAHPRPRTRQDRQQARSPRVVLTAAPIDHRRAGGAEPLRVRAYTCYTNGEAAHAGPTWSPDSTAVAWAGSGGIWIKRNAATCTSPAPRLVIRGGSAPDWSPAPVR